MNITKTLEKRSNTSCEFCKATDNLQVYTAAPATEATSNDSLLACQNCCEQMDDNSKIDPKHWHCLKESMWSEVPVVQVMSWRMLNRLKAEDWALNLFDMLYLDEETLAWAKSTETDQENSVVHVDSNGTVLQTGDTVVLIKTLNVKGSSVVAKRGTAVRRISLVADNPEHIEGRVDGQQIVILTKFVKKS